MLDPIDDFSNVTQGETSEILVKGIVTHDPLDFAKELDRFVELAAMLVIGSLLARDMLTATNLALAAVLIGCWEMVLLSL